MNIKKIITKLFPFILVGVTLVYFPNWIDIIQLPKFVLLISGSILLLGLGIVHIRFTTYKLPVVILFLFICMQLIGGLINNQNFYEILIGTWGRYNGLATSIALCSLFFVASSSIITNFDQILIKTLVLLGFLLSIYGILEILNVGPITQVTRDSNLKLTLGNSNFASVMLVITATATLSRILFESNKFFLVIPLICQIYLIYKANAQQGWLTLILSLTFLTGFWLAHSDRNFSKIWKRKNIFMSLMLFTALLFLVAKLVTKIISLRTLIDRFHIWQASLSLIKDNLFFGVGQDAFGLWFPKYMAESGQLKSLRAEYHDNAHNIFLNYLSNSGIFVFLLYLSFIVFIGYRSYLILRSNKINFNAVTLVCFWIVLQAQSLISVDNITLNMWTWTISGAIFACSLDLHEFEKTFPPKTLYNRKFHKYNLKVYLVSLTLPFFLIFIYPTLKLEQEIKYLTSTKKEIMEAYDAKAHMKLIYELSFKARYPEIRNYSAVLFFKEGKDVEALALALSTTEKFPRSILAFEILAQIYEKNGKLNLALSAWQEALKLDPLNIEFERNVARLSLKS
jgi:hypothetical protein